MFGILAIFSIFTVISQTENIDIQQEGNQTIKSLVVDTDWSNEGVLYNDLESDSDKIFVDRLEKGYWISNLRSGSQMDVLNISGIADPSDGQINYTLNFWNGNKTTIPDQQISGSIEDVNYNYKLENLSKYDLFEVNLSLEETSNNNNERPNIQSLRVDYIETENTLGLTREATRILILFVLFTSVIFALINAVQKS